MQFGFYDWAAFLGIPVLALLVARLTRSTRTWRAYFYASGQLSSLSVANTYLGANLTFTSIFLILSEEAYIRGAWVFSVPVCWLLGTFLFVRLYPSIKPYIEKNQTLHEAMGTGYGSNQIRKWASVWTIVAFVGTVGLEFYGAFVLLRWIGIPDAANIAVAMSLAFITAYFTVTGGLRGVASADYVLNGASLVAVFLLLVFGRKGLHKILFVALPQSTSHPSVFDNVLFLISMVIIFVPFQLCTLDSWQRLVAWKSKNEKSPALMLYSTSFGLALVYCVPIIIGMASRGDPFTTTFVRPFELFMRNSSMPVGVTGLVFGGFAAAILSTADELLNCCGLSLIFDTFQVARSEAEDKLTVSGQFYTAAFAFISAALACLSIYSGKKISDLALAVFSTQVVFAIPLLLMFKNPNRARKMKTFVSVSMILGFFIAVMLVLVGWKARSQDTVDAAPVIAFLVSAAVMLVGMRVYKD